jgi:hypothetical protein
LLTVASASSSGRPPAYTSEPSMSGAKRAPSSLVKNATTSGRRVTSPAASSARTTSRPASTPEISVIAPAGGDGVDVRAGHHRRDILASAPKAEHVADAIDADFELLLAHPGQPPGRARTCRRR